MDYDKTNHRIDEVVDKIEDRTLNIFTSNLNFIRNLRKYITNEYEQFEGIVVRNAIIVSSIIIVIELVFMLFGYKSILGLIPKLITTALLFTYLLNAKSRRKQ